MWARLLRIEVDAGKRVVREGEGRQTRRRERQRRKRRQEERKKDRKLERERKRIIGGDTDI